MRKMSYFISPIDTQRVSTLYEFEKTFAAEKNEHITLKVSADTRYQLYLNGALISEGPCQGQEEIHHYERVSAMLCEGENTLLAKVLYIPEDRFISCYRRECAAFWLDGEISNGVESRHLESDEAWSCRRNDSIRFYWMEGLLHNSMPPQEAHAAKQVFTPLAVKKLCKASSVNLYGLLEKYPLSPRPIPQMATHAAKELQIVRRGKGFIDLDAGAYTTAKVDLALKATAGKTVKIIFAECTGIPEGQFRNEFQKDLRDALDDAHRPMGAAVDQLEFNGEKQHFSPFWFRAFRFIRLEFDPDTEVELLDATYSPYFYPFVEDGKFHSDNAIYDQMWEVSRNTLLCCSHEMFVDCPYYEQQQYQMDSALEALFAYRLSNDTRLCKKSLCDLGASQMSDGLLQANYPSTHVQIIPNFTLYWVLMLRDYLRYTDDRSTVKSLLGIMDKAFCAFEDLKDENGLIKPTKYWNYTDWVEGWDYGVLPGANEEPSVITCLLYAAAHRAAAEICEALGNSFRAAEYCARAEEMAANVNKFFFDAEAGLYRNVPSRREFSQHAALWAVLAEAVTGEEAGRSIDRAFSNEVKIAVPSHSMNHYFFRALEKADRYEYAPRLFAGWKTMLDNHCTTWCEGPTHPRSECHAWSSAPMYEFSAMLMGVYPTGNGYSRVRIKPVTNVLECNEVSGTVPTPHGVICVDWKKEADNFTLHVTLPTATMEAEVILPNGDRHIQKAQKEVYTCKI